MQNPSSAVTNAEFLMLEWKAWKDLSRRLRNGVQLAAMQESWSSASMNANAIILNTSTSYFDGPGSCRFKLSSDVFEFEKRSDRRYAAYSTPHPSKPVSNITWSVSSRGSHSTKARNKTLEDTLTLTADTPLPIEIRCEWACQNCCWNGVQTGARTRYC